MPDSPLSCRQPLLGHRGALAPGPQVRRALLRPPPSTKALFMNVSITFGLADLRQLVASLVPLRLELSDDKQSQVLECSAVTRVELVPTRGLRVVCVGHVTWPVLFGIPVPLALRELSIILQPSVESNVSGKPELRLRVYIEHAELRAVPELLERSLVDRVGALLAEHGSLLDVDLAALGRIHARLPDAVVPALHFVAGVESARVVIGAAFIELQGDLCASFVRRTEEEPKVPTSATGTTAVAAAV
jgi:hypothetical protein